MAAIRIIQGDTSPFTFEVTDVQGDPFNLTDYTADFFVKRSLQDSDAAAEFHGTLTDGIVLVYTAEDGVLRATIDKDATADLRYGRVYYWYLSLTHTPTGSIYTPAKGMFLVVLPDTE